MSDQQRLADLIAVWRSAVDDLIELLEGLGDEQWHAPTDLPGWDVQACAAHTAHLESVLAGNPEETADIGEPAHVTGLLGQYTEIGVVTRRDHTPQQLLAELREVTDRRYRQLQADPPRDASARPEVIFGGVPWTWETLLRNRPLDVWMHEQDVRRAVDRPGNLDSAAARHTTEYLLEGGGFVLGKRVGAAPGTTLLLDVEGSEPAAFGVAASGRGERLAQVPDQPTATVRMDRESFVVLAGGRRAAAPGAVRIEGDEQLGQRFVAHLATTP